MGLGTLLSLIRYVPLALGAAMILLPAARIMNFGDFTPMWMVFLREGVASSLGMPAVFGEPLQFIAGFPVGWLGLWIARR